MVNKVFLSRTQKSHLNRAAAHTAMRYAPNTTGYTASSACIKSARRSSRRSIPTDIRKKPSCRPKASRSWGERKRCELVAGWERDN